jgi:hypothetical protein
MQTTLTNNNTGETIQVISVDFPDGTFELIELS